MRRDTMTVSLVMGIMACASPPAPRTPDLAPAARTALTRTSLITLPLLFEANQGQAERKYRYIARRKQDAVLFGEHETTFSLGGVVDRDPKTGTWTESPIITVRTTRVGGRDGKVQACEPERAGV